MGLETAAIISLTSLAVGAAGSAKSFSDASKQKAAATNAEEAAEKARDAALAKLDVNYLKGTSIAKEAYKLDRERWRSYRRKDSFSRERSRSYYNCIYGDCISR